MFCFYRTVSFLHNRVFLLQPLATFHTPSRFLGPWFSRTLPIFSQDLLQPKPLSIHFQGLFQILEEEDLIRPHPEAGIPQHLWWWWEGTRGFSFRCLTNPGTCDSTDDPPTERTCISSWNRSARSGRDFFRATLLQHRGLATEAQQLLPHLEDV